MTSTISGKPKPTQFRSDLIRLKDHGRRVYLHLDGVSTTQDRRYSWLGTPAQAKALRDRALIRDGVWPFDEVER